MKIEVTTMILDCVSGRRGIFNTASSLRPCQNPWHQFYILGIVFLLLTVFQVDQVMGGETAAPADPLAATESPPTNLPAPMTDIHDILSPVSVGIHTPWLVPVLLTLAATALLAAVWWLWKKHKKKSLPIETIVPELPPEMVANRALDGISDLRRLDGKTFYFHLSAILRQYVSGRYAVGAPEMTTEEFLPCIDRLSIDTDLTGRLKRLCRAMDPVKFGAATAIERQMQADLLFVRTFVKQTTPTLDTECENGSMDAPQPLLQTVT